MSDVREGLYYTKDHQWVLIEGKKATFGMTDFAQHELGDVVYVDLPKVGDEILAGDEIGAMESVKSIEPIYAPITGKIIEINEILGDAPESVNTSPYGDGWMAAVEMSDPSEIETLLNATEYRKLV